MADKKWDDFAQVSKNVADMAQAKLMDLLDNVLDTDALFEDEVLSVIRDTGVDWSSSMSQTYEFYIVDPATWADDEKLDNVESCTITRDASDETKGTAQITSESDLSDKYVRCYLIVTQNTFTYKIPLGTYMYQAPGFKYNGVRSLTKMGIRPSLSSKKVCLLLGML